MGFVRTEGTTSLYGLLLRLGLFIEGDLDSVVGTRVCTNVLALLLRERLLLVLDAAKLLGGVEGAS